MTFQEWLAHAAPGATRSFSLARHALVAALRAGEIGSADRVLLPEFICRDLLAALHAVGAEPVWYPVGVDLRPASVPETWPQARAVIAIDYFGFPQPLEAFRTYCRRTGALLIEDNAHGFLSRDEDGRWLGTRADAGLFSLRKTIAIADGAMLLTNVQLGEKLPPPLAETGSGLAPASAIKAGVRRLPLIGPACLAVATDVVRAIRHLKSGHAIAPSSTVEEMTMPCAPAPHAGFAASLQRLDVESEIERRRALYRDAEAEAQAVGIISLFRELPRMVSPYGFAFRSRDASALARMTAWTRARGLSLLSWPELPSAVLANAPGFYRDIRVVNFL